MRDGAETQKEGEKGRRGGEEVRKREGEEERKRRGEKENRT